MNNLAGVRVVDFGHYLAGPMAALLLADAGAEVVHVDSPAASSNPGLLEAFLHRGKRRLTLDLKLATDVNAARALVRDADVVIENFRPGVMDRLGLASVDCLAANPRLIYCSMPGFAADDERGRVRGWEGILHAATAGYRPLNEHWDPTGRRRASVDDRGAPIFTPITTASNFGAMLGATMVAAALVARERTGRGQHVELPLAEAMIEAYSTMMGTGVYDDTRTAANIMLSDLSYRCADGAMVDMSPHPKFIFRLLREVGLAEEWDRRGLIDLASTSFHLATRDELRAEFTALIGSRTAQDWDELAMRINTPLTMVRTPGEWLTTPHARESGAVVELDDPMFGPVVMPGAAFDAIESVGPAVASTDAGSKRRDGFLRSAVDRPLDGLRVIDITQAVAGPTATRLLADLGADVIKIGSPTPGVTDGIVAHLHRGKRTMLLDTRVPSGRAVLDRLISSADALVTNFTATAAAKYGIDETRVRGANSDLVYCAISAYGATGPWAARRAYENQCNAATGMSWSYGAPFGWTLYQPTPINDAAAGVLAAFATIAALFARGRGAPAQRVGSSLAQASTWHQASTLVRRAGSPAVEERSRGVNGWSALQRLYRTRDRSLFVAARSDDVARLLNLLEVSLDDETIATADDPDGALAAVLAGRFASATSAEWESALRTAGIDAMAVQTMEEAVAGHLMRDLVYFDAGIDGDVVARPGIGSWMSKTPPVVGANPGPVGSQALEILHELGLSDDEIAQLADEGTVCRPDRLPQIALRT